MVFKDILILNFILFFTKELKQNIFLYNKNYIFRKIIHSVFGISLTFMALLFPTGNSFAQNEHYDYKFQVGKPVNTKVILPGEHGSATWYPCNYKNDCDEIPGLKYRTDNSKLGYIEGTPTKAGDYLFSFFQNKVFGNEYAYVGVHVDPADVVITTASLSPGRIGVTYPATTLAATGGSGAYTWSANKLPADLTLDATSGIITGTPTEAGSFDVKVTATDKEGHEGHMTYTLVIAAAPTIEITPKALPAGKINQVYAETTLSVSGGTAPYTYKAEGLPEGLSLTGNKIAGTPTEARSFDVKVTATDKEGYEGHMTYTLVVAEALPVAQSHSMRVMAGTTAFLNLTEGAT
ncbi:Ig domain-containing protein [Brucella anthropi]|uniref:Ig domain-containing protein n=2 Tax=Brucella anthropi TaxID=529 RepID=UPI00384CF24F